MGGNRKEVMERENSNLQSLVDAIKASEVVELRIQLINQLGDTDISEKTELASLVKHLASWIFWEDSTCLDVSQCKLNKTILDIAAKYLKKDTSGCLEEFLSFGTKASLWSAQHFQMTLTSIEESQEEHSSIFFQLVLELLRFFATMLGALERSPVLGQKASMLTVEKFVLEQLNLTTISISERKSIHSVSSEVLKVAQEVLNAVVRLCRSYSNALNSKSREARVDNGVSPHDDKVNNANHVMKMTTCTISHLYKLGILAAKGGGSLVGILNASWKGVVSLLQLNDGDLAANVNVADILLALISLVTESLRCAAESWSSRLKENIALAEAKRMFLPGKFYLINAVRILSQYPCQTFTTYREIILCVLTILAFGISLSQEAHLKASSEALTDLLEPTSSLLLHTLLNSDKVKEESKLHILEWLFTDEDHLNPIHPEETNRNPTSSMVEIFTVSCETLQRASTLRLGRVFLFLNLLRSSSDLGEDVRLGLSRKLPWFLYSLTDDTIYPSVLVLHIPEPYSSGAVTDLVWQPMFPSILCALKTFMIVAASSSLSWGVMELFLLENLLHPHFLVWEIVTDLWCFFVRHAEIDMLKDTIDRLFSLFKCMVSSQPALSSGSVLRKMARWICLTLTYAPQTITDQVYSSIITDGRSPSSSIMYVTLLIEGFPLNLLSDNLKTLAIQRIVSAYCSFMESDYEKLQADRISRSCSSYVVGEPVYALSSALRSLQISSSNIDCKTLKFTLALIDGFRSATDGSKNTYCELLSQILAIISKMKHLYTSTEMAEVILELRTLFGTTSNASNEQLSQCKPDLAVFMAGLGHMEIIEVEGNPLSTAIWEMYHMLLREKHWALVNLAITAFGYFAARTSCNQLWRFVPRDAALSFDTETGNEINEDRFMCELKAFLEKEVALTSVEQSTGELALLAREGLNLKEMFSKVFSIDPEDPPQQHDNMDIDDEVQVTKKRKLPDEICQGMSLLQSGLKAVGDGLALWQKEHSNSTELQKFSSHLSRLEDEITNLVSLAGSR